MEQAVTQFQVEIMCNESTGFDEVTNYFATEADMMLDLHLTLMRLS